MIANIKFHLPARKYNGKLCNIYFPTAQVQWHVFCVVQSIFLVEFAQFLHFPPRNKWFFFTCCISLQFHWLFKSIWHLFWKLVFLFCHHNNKIKQPEIYCVTNNKTLLLFIFFDKIIFAIFIFLDGKTTQKLLSGGHHLLWGIDNRGVVLSVVVMKTKRS